MKLARIDLPTGIFEVETRGAEMMTVPELIPISELRLRQKELLNRLQDGPILLTHHGNAAAVLMTPQEWNELQETIEDLEDTIDELEAKIEVLSGEDKTVSWQQLKAERERDGIKHRREVYRDE